MEEQHKHSHPQLRQVAKVEVLVLVDNETDGLSTPTQPAVVTTELTAHILHRSAEGPINFENLCCAAHGLSLLVTATAEDGEQHTIIFDAGPCGRVFRDNVRKLRADLSRVEGFMLSHGHSDHSGGLLSALELIREASRNGSAETSSEIPVYTHPGMWVQRGFRMPFGVVAIKDNPTKEEIAAKGGKLVESTSPMTVLNDFFYISGEIPRVTPYEKGIPSAVSRANEGEEWQLEDPFIMDERYLAVNVKGCGLVIFSACSHAGIVNVTKDAKQKFPSSIPWALVGGYHLAGPGGVEERIPDTVNDLQGLDVHFVVPGHCTGWRAKMKLAEAFGNRFIPCVVGQSMIFKAHS
jgi:7,8-dihydropterin-6-yl-methyl-4-(beta-D-ribofuranosyl)aminobenzene 5'-phosphate synthase